MPDSVRRPDFAPLSGFDLDPAAEPFALIPGHGPARAARMIARTYATIEASPTPALSRLVATLVAGDHGPLAQATLAIAGQAEAREAAALAGGQRINAYHNVQHTLEVLLNVHYLALRNDAGPPSESLTADERGLLYLAAVIHDLDHDGGVNGAEPYRLERKSLDQAAPHLAAAGVAAADCQAVTLMVLGTDPGSPARYLRSLHRLTFLGETGRPLPPAVPELAGLAGDSRLLRLAGLLSDGDLLSSAGLTPGYASRQTAKLAAELGRSFGAREAIGFFDHIVGGHFATAAGRFFAPNLNRLRALALRGGLA